VVAFHVASMGGVPLDVGPQARLARRAESDSAAAWEPANLRQDSGDSGLAVHLQRGIGAGKQGGQVDGGVLGGGLSRSYDTLGIVLIFISGEDVQEQDKTRVQKHGILYIDMKMSDVHHCDNSCHTALPVVTPRANPPQGL
jgi:hypothetical protein